MTHKQQYRLARIAQGTQVLDALLQRELISMDVFRAVQNQKVAAALANDRASHWHPVIMYSRLALLHGQGFALRYQWSTERKLWQERMMVLWGPRQ